MAFSPAFDGDYTSCPNSRHKDALLNGNLSMGDLAGGCSKVGGVDIGHGPAGSPGDGVVGA